MVAHHLATRAVGARGLAMACRDPAHGTSPRITEIHGRREFLNDQKRANISVQCANVGSTDTCESHETIYVERIGNDTIDIGDASAGLWVTMNFEVAQALHKALGERLVGPLMG
jgi:hypothetical protein